MLKLTSSSLVSPFTAWIAKVDLKVITAPSSGSPLNGAANSVTLFIPVTSLTIPPVVSPVEVLCQVIVIPGCTPVVSVIFEISTPL